MNLAKLKSRFEIIRRIRQWFDAQEFLEVQTPRLVGLPGQEPHLEPFWTTVQSSSLMEYVIDTDRRHIVHNLVSVPAALVTSPEYMMKRLLAEGFDKIYDLGPCFRNNEPWDEMHDPEFLLLEWYRRNAGIDDLMRDTEEMIRWVATSVQTEISKSVENALKKPFRRLTCEDAWREYTGIELAPILEDRERMARLCRDHGQTVVDNDTWDDLYFKIFLTEIEPKLGWQHPSVQKEKAENSLQPVFLYRYPASQAALARQSADDPRWADRVELYIGKFELANGFAELSHEAEQRKRFDEEHLLRLSLGKKTWPFDERFLCALPDMGDAAGIAFGVDRFVMLLTVTGATSINDILPASARERFLS